MVAIGGKPNISAICSKRRSSTQLRASNRDNSLLHCTSPLLAQSGHHDRAEPCLLLGVKRTSVGRASMSADDPKQTLSHSPSCFQS
jgi:hypothetical protein